jgi:tetratricopeptide (TPR) repeat protein
LAYQRAGRYPEAIEILTGLLRWHPRNAEYRKDLAICEYLSGRTEEAIRDLEQSLRLDPGMLAAYQSLGAILEQRARPADALRLYRRALQVKGGSDPHIRGQIEDSLAALEASSMGQGPR